jgi:hypothetical protein
VAHQHALVVQNRETKGITGRTWPAENRWSRGRGVKRSSRPSLSDSSIIVDSGVTQSPRSSCEDRKEGGRGGKGIESLFRGRKWAGEVGRAGQGMACLVDVRAVLRSLGPTMTPLTYPRTTP